jgi:cytochrome c-type biogenesis protein CcmF
VAGFDIEFTRLREVSGPNFIAEEGEFEIRRNGELLTTLHPQKRIYQVRTDPMTEAGIDARWNRHIFVALGESLGAGAWSVRVQYKPMISFIWFGCIVMALGGLLAATDNRYRQPAAGRTRAGKPVGRTAEQGSH